MSGNTDTASQILATSTAIGGGILLLPATGSSKTAMVLALLAITAGVVVLTSFVASRIAKKFIK